MLITLEGVDGVGKTTQINLLKEIYPNAVFTKEPGGTQFGRHLREILLKDGDKISNKAEMFLFLADRAEHYDKIIHPNLKNIIFSDRGFVSGIAYAMANECEFDIEQLFELNKIAINGNFSDKFIFLKAEKTALKKRLIQRAGGPDKIEQRGIDYLCRVQDYMDMIFKNSDFNVLIIDAMDDIDLIHEKIKEFIK